MCIHHREAQILYMSNGIMLEDRQCVKRVEARTEALNRLWGGVGWAPNHVNGVSSDGFDGYIHSMPIVGVYTLTTIAAKKAISAKLILAHEMMHVMGIRDTYNSQPGHKATGSNNQTCIMADFSVKYRNYSTFCTDIEAGRTPPFCAACEKMIEKVIDSRYFPAS